MDGGFTIAELLGTKVPVRQRKGAGVSATDPKTAGVDLAKR